MPSLWSSVVAAVTGATAGTSGGMAATAAPPPAAADFQKTAPLPRAKVIVQIVADDLGYQDIGVMNGNITHTPHINSLFQDGVFLSSFYTFRVCAPSRAASMTGRYPWGVGFYDMSDDPHHCVHPDFKMLPAYLREQGGFRTHATGKWSRRTF